MIEKNSVMKGMLSSGSTIRKNAYIGNLAVVAEGGQVIANSAVVGNPAFFTKQVKQAPPMSSTDNWLGLEILKLLWLAFELYLFFGIIFLAQYLWGSQLSSDWHYVPLLTWILLFVWFSPISLLTSIIFKWVLIAKRKPDLYKDTLCRKFADWAADWHYIMSTNLLYCVTTNSHIWNVILMFHGMDIDFESKIQGLNFLPSKMDLIQVRRSFISGISFHVKESNHYHLIEISRSSIGLFSHLAPGVRISNTVIPPQTFVSQRLTQDVLDRRSPGKLNVLKVLRQECISAICYFIFIMSIFVHLVVPSYDLWTRVFVVDSIWMAVIAILAALVVQSLVYFCLLFILQSSALSGALNSNYPWSNQVYAVYATAAYAGQTWSVLSTVILGSLTYNVLLRMLGVTFEGCAFVFDAKIYEHKFITLADKTLIDQSPGIVAHYGLYNKINIGPCKVGGVIHEGIFAANALVTSEESGPWHSFVGTYEEIAKKQNLFVGNDCTDNVNEMGNNQLMEHELSIIEVAKTEKVDDGDSSSSEYANKSDCV